MLYHEMKKVESRTVYSDLSFMNKKEDKYICMYIYIHNHWLFYE